MNCADIVELLRHEPRAEQAARRRAAERHAAACAHCGQALAALAALSAERARKVPEPLPGAPARAVQRAMQVASQPRAARHGFWAGAAVGGAVAAALALAAMLLLGRSDPPAATTAPRIALAPGNTRDVSVALSSAEALDGVEIHVVLTGAIALRGYDTRELRWMTSLARGVNELSLPVEAVGPGGGQLTVEVVHAGKRRTFVVDVLG